MSTKPKLGAPSKFKPEYCEKLIEHMGKGLSFDSFSSVVRVNQDTLHEWVKVHEDFAEAKKIAFSDCMLFWEKAGIDGLHTISEFDKESGISTSKSLNASVWIFNMKNRFKWRDKQPDENDQVNVNLTLADRMAKARTRTKK